MTTTADLRAAAQRELLVEVARNFGEIRFKATGDSMLPSVWPGDLLTVRRQSRGLRTTNRRRRRECQFGTVGAVYDRPYFIESRNSGRS